MQPIARDGLTATQVAALLRDAEGLFIDKGCEIVDRSLQSLEDISADLREGTISRNSYDTLHATASLSMSRRLEWGADLIRPYMTISDGEVTARFNLGVYLPAAPATRLGETPTTWPVTGYDILSLANDRVGASYAVTKGTGYLAAVESILVTLDFPAGSYLIDQTRGDAVLPSDRVWVLDTDTRWLNVINDLLGAVGYGGLWSDWDGRLRVQAYTPLSDRPPEWLYDTEQATSMVEPERELQEDFYDVPNRWVFVRQNDTEGPAPVEGNGIYTYSNDNVGPTSVDARRGRVVTASPVYLDVADQAALVSRAQLTIDADIRLSRKVVLATSPNPLHWHFDKVLYDDPAIGRYVEALVTSWTLPLSGESMGHEWTVL